MIKSSVLLLRLSVSKSQLTERLVCLVIQRTFGNGCQCRLSRRKWYAVMARGSQTEVPESDRVACTLAATVRYSSGKLEEVDVYDIPVSE